MNGTTFKTQVPKEEENLAKELLKEAGEDQESLTNGTKSLTQKHKKHHKKAKGEAASHPAKDETEGKKKSKKHHGKKKTKKHHKKTTLAKDEKKAEKSEEKKEEKKSADTVAGDVQEEEKPEQKEAAESKTEITQSMA